MSGVKDPLSSPARLMEALGAIPSKAVVLDWMELWPQLDAEHGAGHALALEHALLGVMRSPGRAGFRAVWVVALLCSKGLMTANPEDELLSFWNGTEDESCRRECMRALLFLGPSNPALSELLGWSTQVVHLDAVPAAIHHYALRIIARSLEPSREAVLHGMHGEIHNALSSVILGSHPVHLKKKAALLKARLS
jgi:hypothetical protein